MGVITWTEGIPPKEEGKLYLCELSEGKFAQLEYYRGPYGVKYYYDEHCCLISEDRIVRWARLR